MDKLFKAWMRYLRLTNRFDSAGNRTLADAHYVFAIAYKLAPRWQEATIQRGQYFQPSGPVGLVSEQELEFLRKPEVLDATAPPLSLARRKPQGRERI